MSHNLVKNTTFNYFDLNLESTCLTSGRGVPILNE